MKNDLLFRLSIDAEMMKKGCHIVNKQLVVPLKYCELVVQVAHETPTASHLGESKTESSV